MSETHHRDNDSESQYRINLNDIKKVGPAAVEKLKHEGITSVDELHLCRKERYRQMQRRFKENDHTIPEDAWEHIAAVGSAVHYTGSSRVQAKHLTGPIKKEADHKNSFIDIAVSDPEPDNENQQQLTEWGTNVDDDSSHNNQLITENTAKFCEAIRTIQSAYGDSYQQGVEFEAEYSRFLHNSESFPTGKDDEGANLPTGIIQSIIRYQHEPEVVAGQGDFNDVYRRPLIEFAESLSERNNQ